MRIFHVSNGNLKHCGKRYYDQARKINNGLVRNGHDVFFMSDRDVARSANIFSTSRMGRKYANKYFLETCRNYDPDIILLGHADIISLESLQQIKKEKPSIKIGQWNVDPVFHPGNEARLRGKLPAVDATFITTAGKCLSRLHSEHATVSFFPNISDSSIEWPKSFEHNDQENDVFWALRATKGSYKGNERIEIPLFLESSGKVAMDYHGMNGKAELFNNDYFKAIDNCRMGLNISMSMFGNKDGTFYKAQEDELYLYSSDRISHYMGSGLLLFASNNNKLEDLFIENEEIILFDSKEELLEKITYFKENDKERQRVAKNGWEKIHRDFNEKVVTRYMVETILAAGSENTSANYAWPTDKY
jgi:hypothetical protein